MSIYRVNAAYSEKKIEKKKKRKFNDSVSYQTEQFVTTIRLNFHILTLTKRNNSQTQWLPICFGKCHYHFDFQISIHFVNITKYYLISKTRCKNMIEIHTINASSIVSKNIEWNSAEFICRYYYCARATCVLFNIFENSRWN